MNAGPELDQLILEKIFGAVKEENINHDSSRHVWIMPNGTFYNEETIPQYSTDIGAAWSILEKFKSSPWSIERRTDGTLVVTMEMTAAPYNICLAALRTLRVIP